jgi:hypothetical protein
MDAKQIQLLSAVFGLIGGVILAFSLNSVLTALHLAIEALSTSIESIASKGAIYIFEGVDTHIKNADRTSKYWVRAGLACLVISAVLAAWGIYAA